MRNNDTLDPLVSSLSFLRKVYSCADIDVCGDVAIEGKIYPDFFKDLLVEIGKLERVIASSVTS